jgi:aquaglyceroporin related protein, other eukaryote
MILIIFGTGVDCQVTLSSSTAVASSQKGVSDCYLYALSFRWLIFVQSYLSISFGWAIGTAMGVWVSGGISGGHINPAVTLALAAWRGFPWRKVPGYIFAQLMGGKSLYVAEYMHM